MSIPEAQKFVCPVCGWTIKAPFTEKDLMEHIKKHPEDKTLLDKVARRYRGGCKKGG
jgi:hypothetical protein